MPQVRVREKHQVTLPVSIVRAANINPNDVLDVTYRSGVITLVTSKAAGKKRSLRDYVGAMQGVYGSTAQEVHSYINNERDAWGK